MAEVKAMGARELLAGCERSAVLSECGKFRYHLSRTWSPSKPRLLFVMLNPSTADAMSDDPTIRRCATFALVHDFGGFEVVNLFAYRAADPLELRRAGYPVGSQNDYWIERATRRAVNDDAPVCLAYGMNAADLERPQLVLPLLRRWGARLQCLKITRSGYPQHPLMLASSCRLQPFDEAAVQEAMHG